MVVVIVASSVNRRLPMVVVVAVVMLWGVKQYMTSKNRESWEINSYILNMGEILVMYGGQANIAHPNTLRGHP